MARKQPAGRKLSWRDSIATNGTGRDRTGAKDGVMQPSIPSSPPTLTLSVSYIISSYCLLFLFSLFSCAVHSFPTDRFLPVKYLPLIIITHLAPTLLLLSPICLSSFRAVSIRVSFATSIALYRKKRRKRNEGKKKVDHCKFFVSHVMCLLLLQFFHLQRWSVV